MGAGPGDPGLLTVRAVDVLRRADVVLYDYLANPAVLEHVPPRAEMIHLGHHSGQRVLTPAEINERMVAEARHGHTVVRLKGGDPSVFGRGSDETTALRAADIRYEIIPGITTALAAAAYCEIPITHHQDASAVALIAGREREGKDESHIDYKALAHFPGTLIFYMGVAAAPRWSRALLENGKPADTPVAIVRWCTRAQQETLRCSLGDVGVVIEEYGVCPPAVIVVGAVVQHAPQVSWFASRPLFGVRVLATGSPSTAAKLCDRLATLGADVLTQPAIHVEDPPDWAPVDAALDAIDQYDWLVFSSSNGVDYLFRRLYDRGVDVRRLGRVKLAAIGTGTAERLAEYHLRADLVPEQFVAESLAASLIGDAKRKRFLIARASRGRRVLRDAIVAAGGKVDEIVVYSSLDREAPDPNVEAALVAGEIDWIAVTSTSTVQSLARLYGANLRSAQFASIGPVTSQALRENGIEPAAEAAPQTTAGLVEAILGALGK